MFQESMIKNNGFTQSRTISKDDPLFNILLFFESKEQPVFRRLNRLMKSTLTFS